MTRIWERLWIGDLDDAERLGRKNRQCIDTIASLCQTPVRTRKRTVNYLYLPIEDDSPVSVREFDSIIDAIAENVRWGNVLLHCGAGMSRSPIMMAAWMDCVGYKNIDAALAEIKKLRPIIDPSDILLDSVRELLR